MVDFSDQWTEHDSKDFIDQGHFFIPARELQVEVLCDLALSSLAAGSVVDLCCGEGLLTCALLERDPHLTVVAYDGSTTMLQHVSDRGRQFGARLKTAQIDIEELSWRSFDFPVKAVVSSLAVHHLDDVGKRLLFNDMKRGLVPGGRLIIADLVLPKSQVGRSIAARRWDESVRQRSLDATGDLRAFNRFNDLKWNYYSDPAPDALDKPSPLSDQLRWLEEAGFEQVEVHWMDAGHAIFSGAAPGP